MAQSPDSSTGPKRRGRGFRPAATVLAARVQKAAEGRGFAVARLLTHWPQIAGPELAAVTQPVRIAHARSGLGATLTLLTSGPMAPMVEMQLPALRERVNACYGYNAVQRITLTQTAAQGFAEGRAMFDHAPKAPAPLPDPAIGAEARRIAAQFTDPTLAQAMARLTLNVKSRNFRKT